VLAACGAAGANATKTTTTTKATTPGATTVPGVPVNRTFLTPEMTFGSWTTGAPNPATTVPTERGSRPISAVNDAGQQVIIANGAYLLPEWLVANVSYPITWTNLSGKPQQVVFDDGGVRSPVIPPGGTFAWKSPGFAVSLTYHTVNGHHAKLTLQNPSIAP
jgi:hypothetical protein